MSNSTRFSISRSLLCSAFVLALISTQSNAQEILFQEDFSSGTITGNPQPKWAWDLSDNPLVGMMFGANDIYSISSDMFMSKRRSLKMDFGGRNNFCNLCGGDAVDLPKIENSTACVTASGGPYQNLVYNRSDNFSSWRVKSTSNNGNTVCFDTSSSLANNSFGVKGKVAAGDSIFLPKICGVNGIIGNDKDRRSDCDRAINYLKNVSASDFKYGESLSRRFYIFIPKETVLPDNTLKLGYTRWENTQSVVTISVQRDMTLGLVLAGGENIAFSRDDQSAYRAPREKWIYFEEVYKRETSANSKDGEYTLYVGTEGDNLKKPHTHVENLTYGELKQVSIGGNWQHWSDVKGAVYFDNILISKGYAGPVNRPRMQTED